MNKLIIERSKENITIKDIETFENENNRVLPENYKKLILKYNGGYVENSKFFRLLNSIKYGNNTVEFIIKIHQILEDNIPKEYLPIASDWSDNEITISLKKGNDYGKIYGFYFDVDRVEKIADSLEELLGVKNIDEL